ncbi:MAG: hypothetical protein GY834_10910 [Bacteroidetes bacterium]|nr:hypothetical protein [Bacteroidota bacterium]
MTTLILTPHNIYNSNARFDIVKNFSDPKNVEFVWGIILELRRMNAGEWDKLTIINSDDKLSLTIGL